MYYSVFTYGSLLFPEIMSTVTGRSFLSRPALLPGYARYRVRDASYPGITTCSGASVTGLLYVKVDRSSLKILDRFEGDLYVRQAVDLSCDGQLINAQTYVVAPDQMHHLTTVLWNPDHFKERDYALFLEQCQELNQRTTPRQVGE